MTSSTSLCDTPVITWTEFFTHYERTAFPTVSPSTRRDSRQVAAAIDRLLAPCSLDEVPDRLDELADGLRREGNGPATIYGKLGRIRGMLEFAYREQLLPRAAPPRSPTPPAIAGGAGGAEWRDFRRRYEREVVGGFADTTRKEISYIVNQLERIAAPSTPADLTQQRLSAYQATLRETGVALVTVKKKLGHVKAMLRWAFRMGYLTAPPVIDMPRRARGARVAKGRAISDGEFSRLLAAAVAIVGPARAPSWRRFLRGLFTSGLRLGEALALKWDGDGIRVDWSGVHMTLRIPSEYQKSGLHQEAVPITPEFEALLCQTPEQDRRGYVFAPQPERTVLERLTVKSVSNIISAIGEASGVVVGKPGRKPKYASSHDLRRTMCTRWAHRVPALVLQEIARHANISTTRQYYVGVDAQKTAALLWSAHAAAGGAAQNRSEANGD